MKKVDLSLNQTSLTPENSPLMVSASEKQADEAVDTNYPHFHYEGKDELPIPHKGKMLVEYEIVWEQETKTPGSERYACKTELRRIISAEASKETEAPARRDTSTEDALDKLRDERAAEEDED